MTGEPRIVAISEPEDYEILGRLVREYADGLGIDLSFQHFDEELAGLASQYGPPAGRAFLAWSPSGEAAGCVAVRRFDGDICEMKRLYIRPDFRGLRLGRRLAAAAVEAAKELGYRVMRLDTMAFMKEANGLYRSMGFKEIAAYRHNPIENPIFMELALE
jgi:ribosomal protein S18 acetylase RimI-like enzyme